MVVVDSVVFSYLLFALSSLTCSLRNPVSIALFVVLCTVESRFLIVVPGYFMLLFPKSQYSLWNIFCFGIVPAVAVMSYLRLSHDGFLADVQLALTAITNNRELKKSQMMKLAVGLDQIPMKVLVAVETAIGDVWARIEMCRFWIRSTMEQKSVNGMHYGFNSWVASPWWYLSAQMLPEYAQYFRMLLVVLQLLTSIIVYWNVTTVDPAVGVSISYSF